jgi:hypothetical protein
MMAFFGFWPGLQFSQAKAKPPGHGFPLAEKQPEQ